MASVKFILKLYSLGLGFVVSFASFVWMTLILYVLSQTDPTNNELLMERYLDISFGLLSFTSSLALLYGAFVESKSWLSVWTLGSATVLAGNWTWYFIRKYGAESPESLEGRHDFMVAVSVVYAFAVMPVVAYYKYLESPEEFLKPCRRLHQETVYATRFKFEHRSRGSDGNRGRTAVKNGRTSMFYKHKFPVQDFQGAEKSVPIGNTPTH